MSMNIYIVAERKITFTKQDGSIGHDVQRRKFNAWQTPTATTHLILASANPGLAYIEWIQAQRVERIQAFFADDDIFCEGKPVGFETVCEADEHVMELVDWMHAMEENGFEIKFEEI